MRVIACVGVAVLLAGCGGGETGTPPATTLSPDGVRQVGPSYSPDGKRIAYWTPVSSGWQLWVANPDLSEPIKLPVIGNADATLWSPDGSQLAVNSAEYGPQHAVVVPVAGGAARRVTAGTSVDFALGWFSDGDRIAHGALTTGGNATSFMTSLRTGSRAPLIPDEKRIHLGFPSPDGAHIAYQVVETGSKTTIWVADSTGRNPRQLTSEGFEAFAGPPWSPDGKALLYQSSRTGTSDLWVVPIDGGPARQLTRDVRNDYAPWWSPDGKWVAFLSDRGRQTDIWVVPAAGGEERRVTDTPNREDTALAWRPGTIELTWVDWTERSSVWTVDVATRTEHRLVPDSLRVPYFNVSPDGKWVNLVIDRGGNISDLAVMPISGGEMKLLVTGGGWVVQPVWSTDGSKIAFTSDRGGTQDVWIVDVAGGAPRQLVNWPSVERLARFSGDGSTVSFLSDHDSKWGDLYRVAVSGGEPTRVTKDGTMGGNLVTRPGVADATVQVLNPADGQISLARVRPDGRLNVIWNRTYANPSAISPSGDSIVAEVEQPDGKQRTMLLPGAGGAGRVILGENEVASGYNGWSADGKWLMYQVNVDGAKDIGVLNLADGTKRRLTTTPEDEGGSEITPDGKTVVFRRATQAARLTRANLARLLGGAR